jgi:hypothetical protein
VSATVTAAFLHIALVLVACTQWSHLENKQLPVKSHFKKSIATALNTALASAHIQMT